MWKRVAEVFLPLPSNAVHNTGNLKEPGCGQVFSGSIGLLKTAGYLISNTLSLSLLTCFWTCICNLSSMDWQHRFKTHCWIRHLFLLLSVLILPLKSEWTNLVSKRPQPLWRTRVWSPRQLHPVLDCFAVALCNAGFPWSTERSSIKYYV